MFVEKHCEPILTFIIKGLITQITHFCSDV